MSESAEFARPLTEVDARADAFVDRALQANCKALYAALAAWMRMHPDGANPTTHLAPEDADPFVGVVVSRTEALEFLATHPNAALREVGGTLSRMPPVPFGSIDVIVSTPRLIAVVRATPPPEHMS